MKHKICLHSLHGSIKTYVANVLLIYTFYSSRPLTVWITINWKILREMRMPDHLTCLLRNLYAGQEVTEPDMEKLVQNWERSTSRLYIVTLLI